MVEWLTLPFSEAVVVNPPVRLVRGETYPFVAMADIEPARRSIHSPLERKFQGGGSRFENGDTLMARITPCLENGKVGRYRSSSASQVAHGSTEFIVIRGRRDVTDNEFAYYLTQSDGVRDYAISQMSGTSGRQRVPTQSFDHLYVRVPSLPQQCAIAQILGALDDKIDLNRRMNETLEAMARAIFKDWFIDFGPTRAKAEGHAPYLAPEIWDLFPEALDDENKPVGWEVGTVGNLADTNLQSWTTRNHPSFIEYVDLSNAKWGNIEGISRLPWEQAPSRARRITKPGDTVVGTTRPGNGSFAYISRDGLTVSTGFAVLSPRKLGYRDVVHIAATRQENIDRLANLADGHGGAYPAVKPKEVSDTELLLPGEALLNAFAELAAPLREKVEHAKLENRTLAQTRDLLLPKLMSGEIRLCEAERAVEAAA